MPGGDSSQGEVDFVYQDDLAQVIPVEVKSARNVRARSLKKLMEEGRSPYAVRLSEQNFALSHGESGSILKSLPLYVAFAL